MQSTEPVLLERWRSVFRWYLNRFTCNFPHTICPCPFVTPKGENVNSEELEAIKLQQSSFRTLGYERVYLPLQEVADTPFHIQGDDLIHIRWIIIIYYILIGSYW